MGFTFLNFSLSETNGVTGGETAASRNAMFHPKSRTLAKWWGLLQFGGCSIPTMTKTWRLAIQKLLCQVCCKCLLHMLWSQRGWDGHRQKLSFPSQAAIFQPFSVCGASSQSLIAFKPHQHAPTPTHHWISTKAQKFVKSPSCVAAGSPAANTLG